MRPVDSRSGPLLVLEHGGGVSGFGTRNAMVPATRSAVAVMANSDWAAGVLDTIQSAVLEKMMQVGEPLKVAGVPAKDAALDLLRQITAGNVDRAKLADEFNAFLTADRLSAWSKSLQGTGEISDVQPGPIVERGGLEVSSLRLNVGSTPIRTLMYRAPDGKVEEFLFFRR